MKLFNFAVLSLAIMFAGCGGNANVEVKGTVKVDGGETLSRGIVTLTNANGSFRGNIGEDGTYSIADVPSGAYKASITGTGAPAPVIETNADGSYKKNAPKKKATPPIDSKFESAEKSGLEVTVPGNYDLQVTAAKGGK
ncbi:carboxypeptidase-like regulatory domain-containing protein [Planctomicrobium sp. SH668]|uniref:carboxypeptidase-like regulatory domain-containing protein n=1 Tax=Planctomicrobium sp. SH668 TaxID=3448126 RepID=UPI003F5BA00D